jgi:plastocyanin
MLGESAGRRAVQHAGRLLLVAGGVFCLAGCSGPRRSALHRVAIRGFAFDPESLVVAAGDTVEWHNEDIVPHTSSAGSSRWDSQSIQPGRSWRTVLSTPGTEPYACRLHPTMTAKLVVR